MNSTAINYPVVKFLNRVLADYPLARESLKASAGKTIKATIGPVATLLRVSTGGDFELVGTTGDAPPPAEGVPPNATPDVAFQIPLDLLPRLARGDETAFSAINFEGGSEFASTLSSIARNVSWDVEQDLSQVVGDIAARRVMGGVSAISEWSREAESRLLANVAEYLTEEKREFATARELESLVAENENLRDAVARLEARINAKMALAAANSARQR